MATIIKGTNFTKRKQGFQPSSARAGGEKARLMGQGFPTYIRDPVKRNAHIADRMGDRRYDEPGMVAHFKPSIRPIKEG